ncbi:exocyst complex component 8 [Synchiropus splendidus]|uniref:exocyst complex component 8 n=1 Tax=Synchiropus splendidus TaxID=270530 RepID=UPI00237DD7EC|nr:exocyst complex component 8 [Synchiropus splendidus]XP_053736574.1 exocyst complex component 8 [Synchiropus splendidus]XP_053736575.1 exocyst complex component 8 [Synchiropus splendidus]XP_053736577.1 exocyst complex component 8 [Synchiropus splendidus]
MSETGNRLRKLLESPNFDPQNYVKHLSQQSDGDRDLQEHRQKIQNLADETAQNLKKNVYKNYRQFIETAKEISYLESEMYQLSHILTEQKSIMESVTQSLLSTDKDETSKEMQAAFPKETEELKQRTLTSLLEKVEGAQNIMDTPGRHLIYNGDLVEFDVDNMSHIQKVHAFLMNDCLLIATWLPNRRGTVKYQYNALYDLESFAVVNVKDNPPMKDMFKILMFPDSRIFQAENSKIKKEWLEILDETKKSKVSKDRHKKEEEVPTSPARPEVSTNPFDVDDEELMEAEEVVNLSLEWIQELPEDLDVCIAQRDFEGAVDLLDKLNEYLKDQPVTQKVKELRGRVDERVRQLTEVLVFELSPDRSLRGGPKATRRAVSQLIRLGQSTKACELFLKNRAVAVQTAIRQLRIEGATLLYIHKLCNIFFTSLLETAKEFEMDFAGNTGCYSAFVVWSRSAMRMFVNAFSKQVFDSKESLSTAAECVKVAKEHCQQLTEIGLDLTFTLQSLLVKDVKAALLSYKDVIIEATKHRNSEEMWRRMNLMTPEALAKLKEEMRGCGVNTFEQYTGDDCWVNLSYTVVAFSKQMMNFLEEGLKLYFPELHMVLLESLREIILVAVQHVDYSLRCEQDAEKKAFILQNATFLHDTVLPVMERRFEEGVGKPAKQLQDLRKSTRPVRVNPESTTSLV